MKIMRKLTSISLAVAVALAGGHVIASENSDQGRFTIAGYGDIKYEDSKAQNTSAFSARFVPIFLFNLNEKTHIEAETEISVNESGETEVELEYANAHYFLTNNTTITAGKFLLPFGQFGPNLHPSWINRSAFSPGIYGGLGGHGGYQPMTGLLPVMTDIGIGVQHVISLGNNQKIFIDYYATNGLAEEEGHSEEPVDDHGDEEPVVDDHGEEEEHGLELPELAFEATSADNNSNKAIGGRIAYAFLPDIEIGMSYYNAKYDHDEQLEFTATGIDLNWIGEYHMLRGEYIETDTDALEEHEDGDIEFLKYSRSGWYLQSTFMLGKLLDALHGTDLVIEYSETNKLLPEQRWVYGINYWLDDRSVIKATYEDTNIFDNTEDTRFAIQYSYGF